MEWDQFLFYKLYKAFQSIKRKLTPKSKYPDLNLKLRIGYMQKWIYLYTGIYTEIHLSEGEIIWSGNKLYVPEFFSGLNDEVESKRLLFFWILFIASLRKEKNYKSLFYVFKKVLHEYPSIRGEFFGWKTSLKNMKKQDQAQYKNVISPFQKAILNFDKNSENPALLFDLKQIQKEHKSSEKKESKINKKITEVEILEEDKAKIEEYTLGHNFEKIETLEEFEGQWRDLDGSDEMEEQEEALNELKLKHLIRTDNPVHSTVSSDSSLGFASDVKDDIPEIITARYPEWDYKKKQYKENYCTIQEEIFQKRKPGFTEAIIQSHRPQFEKLKRKLHALITEKMIQKKMNSGEDIDLDAIVERYADLTAGVTPSEMIYTRKKLRESDLFIHFLLDSSLSTDAWVEGKRILDVQKEVLVIFCEALEELGIPFGMSAFSSRTRNHCRYFTIKSSKDKWHLGAERLGAMEPNGYTRIGPALRHTSTLLQKIPARQKWVILLTDAKPNDYDRYEGKYGNEDVHKAIQEMKREKIFLHTLAISTEDKPAIPEMMREASYQLLMHPSKLLLSLEKFFRRAIV